MALQTERVSRVMDAARKQGIGQILVTDPLSIFYLVGRITEPMERFFGLLLAQDTAPVLFANELFGIEPVDGCAVVKLTDNDDVCALLAEHIDPEQVLGVDKNLPARVLVPLMASGAAPAVELGSFAVDGAREIKDAREQELMRRASATNDACMAEFAALVHEGATEREIASQLEDIYCAHGAEGHSFPPIVSFGANAADPHHSPDDTRLKPGDVVLFDVGCRQEGYCSDMTRTFFWGEPSDETARIYDVVRAANEAAEAVVRPGARFCDIDAAARDLITEAGYGPYFTHRLGHQIGLGEHEPGDVSAVHDELVRPGMIFSIEPGVYLPGKTGVRIEDLVLVTEDGCEVLNSYSKEPRRLDA